MSFVSAFLITIALLGLTYYFFDLRRKDKRLAEYYASLASYEQQLKDYSRLVAQQYKSVTTTIVTETPVSVQAKGGILTDGEHAGRKYSKSNDRKRSGKKSVVDVPKKVDNSKRAQSTNEIVPPANPHVDIETYDNSSKTCAPSVSARQSCSSPVESFSGNLGAEASSFSTFSD